METLGSKIKTERKKRFYTQDEFADLVGCKRAYISRIESDLKTPLGLDLIKSISDVIRCDYKYLLTLSMLTRMDEQVDNLYLGDEESWIKARKILLNGIIKK